ncbi:porin [Acetobacter sp.]|uniref:porin n=1 Tax=Acetobacter sp. TaxID=440 RepID=UPI0025BD8A60|nr:porin [Acetobacter sp.]MCH4090446.1 porin [Acetobacter sp.]MCI1299140.1 porin [Acetobacter sp.]MCI1315687.1 porin [Acetobacter sp.]
MRRSSRHHLLVAGLLASSSLFVTAHQARADEYTDLLDILKLKGSLTQGEYSALMTKHRRHQQEMDASDRGERRPARLASARDQERAGHMRAASSAHRVTVASGSDVTPVFLDVQDAADDAAASARSARQSMLAAQAAINDPGIVRADKYVPGKGVTFHAGSVAINLSGFVNGFYTYDNAYGRYVGGGTSAGAGGNKFDASAVRNGYLPAALITKITTTQDGIDMAAVFGMYPGLDNNKPGAMNANSGGSPVGLGTPGIDFRQIYMTFGNKKMGTIKIGRDLGIFGSDAILSDATLITLGSIGGNSAPGNTSLGRIGVGYLYADWIPQISYQSPMMSGVQVTVGVMQPMDEFNFAGTNNNGAGPDALSAQSTHHSAPMAQGKITYDFTSGDLKGRIWAGFLIQHQQRLYSSVISENQGKSATVEAGEFGAKITYRGFEGLGYYYRASGLGTTGLFFDGITPAGNKRNSEGYYVQGSYSFDKRLRLAASYGVSNLYQAPGEIDSVLVRRNESEVGALFYKWTDWIQFVAEYSHTESIAHNGNRGKDNSASGGAVLFF